MLNITKLYIKNSIPLKETKSIKIGEEYFNDEGYCIKCIGEGEFELVRRSPLIKGELLSKLKGDHVLKLFWNLSKKEKYESYSH